MRLVKTLLRTTDVCCSKQSCPKSNRPGSNKSDTDYAQRDKLLTYFPIQVWIELSQLIWVAITNHALDVKVLPAIIRSSQAHRILGWCTYWSSASTYYCFLLPIAAIQNAERGRREDFRELVLHLILRNASQGKVCLPEVECEVEGCKEGGTVCRRVLKPRSPYYESWVQ